MLHDHMHGSSPVAKHLPIDASTPLRKPSEDRRKHVQQHLCMKIMILATMLTVAGIQRWDLRMLEGHHCRLAVLKQYESVLQPEIVQSMALLFACSVCFHGPLLKDWL